MARLQVFAKDVELAVAGLLANQVQPALVALARSELSRVIQSGEGSPNYDTYVNGRLGASESTVVLPGPIVYDFIWWDEIVQFALQYLVERGPERSGRYKRAWIIRANGRIVSNPRDIGIADRVELVNTVPYARKIDVGHMKMRVPHHVIEDARNAVMRIFGNMLTAQRTMIMLPGGYILKGHFKRGFRKFARNKLRADTSAGAAMTYPTLELSMRR